LRLIIEAGNCRKINDRLTVSEYSVDRIRENNFIPILAGEREGNMKGVPARLMLLIFAMALTAIPANAASVDQSPACVELIEKAEAFILDKGKDYALKVFCASKGPFIDKELYVFACSMDNRLLAHPYRRDLIGQDVNDIKDLKGRPLFQEFRKIAGEKGSGWLRYSWSKPGESGEFFKASYIKRIPEHNMYLGVGFYNPMQFSESKNQAGAN
jgi:cytochrome c